jgi:hypothetical protein
VAEQTKGTGARWRVLRQCSSGGKSHAHEEEGGGARRRLLRRSGDGKRGGPTAATWWEKELGSGDMVEAMGDRLRQRTGTVEVGGGWAVRVEESGADRWALQLQCGAAMKLDRSETDLHVVKKFEIKYGYEGFEERNNFLHQNFFRFEMDFN